MTDEVVSDRFFLKGSAFLFRGTTAEAVWRKDFLYRIGKSGFFNKLFYVYIYITSFSYIYTKFSKKTNFPLLLSHDVTKPYYIRVPVHRYFRYEVQFSRSTDWNPDPFLYVVISKTTEKNTEQLSVKWLWFLLSVVVDRDVDYFYRNVVVGVWGIFIQKYFRKYIYIS